MSFVTSLPFLAGTARGCALCPTDSRSCDALRHSKGSWQTETGEFSRETVANYTDLSVPFSGRNKRRDTGMRKCEGVFFEAGPVVHSKVIYIV